MRSLVFAGVCLTVLGCACEGSEADALAITANILARHTPFGGVVDPVFATPSSNQIVGYTRCGDSALWTGAFVAAEAFRYKVTQAPDALANISKEVAALKGLVDVTGTNLLARCMVASESPYASGISSEEKANGIYTNAGMGSIWVGHTSRDEYIGVLFGLGVAYDMVGDATVKSNISALVTRLLEFLTGNNWSVVMPDGSSSTTFLIRPEQMLDLLQIGSHVNPAQFGVAYNLLRVTVSATETIPVTVDVADDNSYFKFNLDYMTFYNLIRLESGASASLDMAAYNIVRNHTATHQNAFFNLVDRGLNGSDLARDAETLTLLDQWLQRSRRDASVDLSTSVAVCGSQACNPIPVPLRVPTDFLWQRSPFQLAGGGSGVIETAGIDYILPYWMARYYGLIGNLSVRSAAAPVASTAPESLASVYGSNLASQTAQATSTTLPTTLGGVTVAIKDAAGVSRNAGLIYVSPGQINLEVPPGTSSGLATFSVASANATETTTATVQNVAPTLFSMSGTGTGVAAATAIQTIAGNSKLQSPLPVFQCAASGCVSVPLLLGVDTPIYVTLYGTGIRNRSSLANVQLTIGGVSVPVLYAGAQPSFDGLDQVNALLTLDLRGKGEVPVILTVDGQTANAVTLNVQ